MRTLLIALLSVFTVAVAAVAQSCIPAAYPSRFRPADFSPSFDYLLDVWLDPNGKTTQEITCPNGPCLWVPWFKYSNSCDWHDLHIDCDAAPDGSYTISCLASDEFSQVGMALAMSARQSKFNKWVTTVHFLIDNSTTGELPAWLARRTGSTFAIKDGGDASDATARIIIALYVAANNDRFTDAFAKASYRTLADSIAHAFLQRDFVTRTITIRGMTITHWLGGGSGTASGNNLDGLDSWAGYYGDVVIALLAAYRSTGESAFLSYADDTIASYFLAGSWDGNNFSVPPWKFKWRIDANGMPYVTCDYCPQWDFKDAPRAVTLCKVPYYAALNGVDLNLAQPLTAYCIGWMQSTGVRADAYQPQYTAQGVPVNPPAHGYYQNGLGAAINFAWQSFDLSSKLNEALSGFSTTSNTFGSETCLGVYDHAFLIVNLGSAIGADLKAFTNCDAGTPDTTPPVVRFRQNCGYVFDTYRLQPDAKDITLHGTATDNRAVQSVTYSLSGSTTGSGTASGTAAWSVGPLALNQGTTIVTVIARDAAGNTAIDTCSVTLSVWLPQQPPPRRRASRP